MKCPNCGNELPANTEFCGFCGTSLPAARQPDPDPQQQAFPPQQVFPPQQAFYPPPNTPIPEYRPPVPQKYESEKSGSKQKMILTIVLAAVIVILTATLIILIVSKKDKPKEKESSTTASSSQTTAAETSTDLTQFQRGTTKPSSTTATAAWGATRITEKTTTASTTIPTTMKRAATAAPTTRRQTTAAPRPSSDPNELYAPVLDMFRRAANNNWSGYTMDYQPGDYPVSYLWYGSHTRELIKANNIGYGFVDIDGNGTPELLMQNTAHSAQQSPAIVDLYTIYNGEIVNLYSEGERSHLSLCEGNRLKYFAQAAMNTVYSGMAYIENGKLYSNESIGTDANMSRTSPWCYSDDVRYFVRDGVNYSSLNGTSTYEPISQDEYNRILAQWPDEMSYAVYTLS